MCGADLTWYYQEGVLLIKGTGEMTDFGAEHDYPWYDYIGDVVKLIIDEGCTSVASCAFSRYNRLSSIDLPSTLKTIGYDAFDYTAISSLELPASLVEYGNAFPRTFITEVELKDGIEVVDLNFACVDEITIPASVKEVKYLPSAATNVTFLGDAPEISIFEPTDINDQVLGNVLAYLECSGFVWDVENGCYTNEVEDTEVTIYYSGEGFEKYIELCPQYN